MSRPVFRAVRPALFLFLSLGVLAAGTAAAQAPAAAPSTHEQAARELVSMVGGADLATSAADAMMGMFGEDEEAASYQQVIRDWTRKVFGSGDLESEIAKIYMEAFSEAELRELTAFYKSPIGQKTLAKLPELMQKGAEIGMKRAQEHAPELMEMLEKAKEAEAAKKGETKAEDPDA